MKREFSVMGSVAQPTAPISTKFGRILKYATSSRSGTDFLSDSHRLEHDQPSNSYMSKLN